MGLVGLLISVLIIILGMGYFFFGTSHSPFSATNDTFKAPIVQELEQGQSVLQAARDVKNLVEQKAAESSQQLTDNNKQTTENSTQPTGELKIINHLMPAGFSVPQKPRNIDTIVLHSSYDLSGADPYSVEGIVKEYTSYGVSSHYLIDRKGIIYRLVEDKNIAYHAGVSKMSDNRTNVNDFSIGIEMMNTEKGQFTNAQYDAVNNLIASLKKQYLIKSVVGHSDIAPDRKTDPWNFDWKRLK